MRVLIISAHPDDETIGMGGTIFKLKSEGAKLYWLVMTRAFNPHWSKSAVAEKLEEVKKIAKFYKFDGFFHAKYKAASLSTYPQYQIVDPIAKVIEEFKPQTVYLPPLRDIHDDHEIVANAGIAATRYKDYIEKVFSYEIPVTTVFSKICKSETNYIYFVDVSNYFKEKLTAMDLYHSELKTLPHPRSIDGLKIIARERGLQSGFEYAECFSLLFARVK